jgi:transposase-like protein
MAMGLQGIYARFIMALEVIQSKRVGKEMVVDPVVYIDKFGSYDTLMFCGYKHLRIDYKETFSNRKKGLEGFWAHAKERLIKHHGVSKQKFLLYLKEMEFKCNNLIIEMKISLVC